MTARLLRDRGGLATVEFAVVGSIFILLVCVAIDLGMLLTTQSALDNAARDGARLILTGQVQNGGGAALFQTQVCADVSSLIPCAKLVYSVTSGSGFAALSPSMQAGGTVGATPFSPGTSGQDVLVQVGYSRPFLIPWVGRTLGGNGSVLLVSTVAFQNDPF